MKIGDVFKLPLADGTRPGLPRPTVFVGLFYEEISELNLNKSENSSLQLRAKGGVVPPSVHIYSLAGVKIIYTQITSSTYFLLSHRYYILSAHYSNQVLYNYISTVLYSVQVLSILGSNKHMHSMIKYSKIHLAYTVCTVCAFKYPYSDFCILA